ncbi:MAG: hypothetical protein QF473_37905 [Planctomycetota bacterium]|nr:hypothetical protein [Planctomycetota bacterium]
MNRLSLLYATLVLSCALPGATIFAADEDERLMILEIRDEYGKTAFEVIKQSEYRDWRNERTAESREIIANSKKLKKRNPKLVMIRAKKRNIKSNDEALKYLQEYQDRLKRITKTKRIEK